MTLAMEGVLAVQAGSQPRVLSERLSALLPPTAPGKAKQGKAASTSKSKLPKAA